VTELMSALSSGLAVGCIYALIALGFTIAYKAGGALNFAQSALMVFAGYICVSKASFGHPIVGLVIASVACAVVSGASYYLGLRRFVGKDPITVTIITMGASFIFAAIVDLIWHANIETFALPGSTISWQFAGSAHITALAVGIIVLTPLVFAAVMAFLRFTRVGVQLRASADSPSLAMRSGINVAWLYSLAWAISGFAAGLSGGLFAATTSVSASLGDIGLAAFPAAVLGGFGSVPGALVGGLILGISDRFAVYYISPTAADVTSYAIMLLVLAVRPTGFFGEKRLVRT
jgi:branched-chain amino acid transport system permease protein